MIHTLDCRHLCSSCTHPSVDAERWKPTDCYSCPLRDSSPRIRRRPTADLGVAVVIISHNYGRFLQEAIDSARNQTVPPREIVVIADKCSDETVEIAERNGLKCSQLQAGNVAVSRKIGYLTTTAPILCFLDADDRLPENYLEQGLARFESPDVGIVHSDLRLFGDQTGLRSYPLSCTFADIDRINQIHAGSLVRREALLSSGAFDVTPGPELHADWWLWRKVLGRGWRASKSSAAYLYRQHGTNMSTGMRQHSYYDRAGLAYETLTLVIPCSGRSDLLAELLQWVNHQLWPHDQLQLLLLDTSRDTSFYFRLRDWIDNCSYPDVRLARRNFGRPGLADDNRYHPDVQRDVQAAVAQMYSWIRTQVTSRFAWIVEDDVLPPLDAAERLLSGFDEQTDSVSGYVPSRYYDGPIAWQDPATLLPRSEGLQVIGGNGFGCVMLRNSALQSRIISCGPRYPNYDHGFYAQFPRGGAKIHWDVICQHRNSRQRVDLPQAGTSFAGRESTQNSH